MNNKTLFSFSLFLVLPAATQCMEKEIVVKPKTMQEIKDERDKIHEKIYNSCVVHHPGFVFLCQSNWNIFNQFKEGHEIATLKKSPDTCSYFHLEHFTKTQCDHIPSAYGYAAIAIKQQYTEINKPFTRSPKEKPFSVPFKEKQEHIKDLVSLGFKIAEIDKDFDKFNAYEAATLSRLLLQHSHFLSEINLPQDIINYISLIMFEIRLFS